MSSDSDATFPNDSSPTPLQLNDSQMRRLSLLLPLLLSLSPPRQTPDFDSGSQHRGRVRIIIVDRSEGAMMVIEGSGDLLSGKAGVSPASKDSIQAMPRVMVTEEEGTDCSICLDAYEVGGEAREMPCKHKFHSGCIEKWLGIHGSCPICRFVMPAEEEDTGAAVSEGELERREGLVSVSVWMRSMDEDEDEDEDEEEDDDPMEVDHGSGGSNGDTPEGEGDSAVDDESWMMLQEPQDMEF